MPASIKQKHLGISYKNVDKKQSKELLHAECEHVSIR